MLLSEPKQIDNLKGDKIWAYAEFNKGYSHIVVDDGCWVVVNGGGFSAWIFPEAMALLRQLPDKPSDYPLWREKVGMDALLVENKP